MRLAPLLLIALAAPAAADTPLIASHLSRAQMPNPYAHIPAQCYIETARGAQNACQYCHTDGLARRGHGNNVPQNGASDVLGDITEDYAFAAINYPFTPNGSINPWENTLNPASLDVAMARQGISMADWDMAAWVRQDNWSPAFARRPAGGTGWDTGAAGDGFRLFPALNPADLPAGPDGFVRSTDPAAGPFADATGTLTGWRAINFTPYGIFTPLSGSVSGIYIRLPDRFMRDGQGRFDLATYAANLDLLSDAIQDRLTATSSKTYLGGAADEAVQPGLYPIGTEFAHPLHYVDVTADGTAGGLPGARAARVKEIRYMYKSRRFDPAYGGTAQLKEESAPAHANPAEGWIENGAGWLLAGWIEDATGDLRPQTVSELVQCVGCHSGHMPQPETGGFADFHSGVGTTVDSTWALPRRLTGAAGWAEADAMGYRAQPGGIGTSTRPDPINRKLGGGEFAHFLRSVVGVSLYGDMPASVDAYLADRIQTARGYSADWPALPLADAEAYQAAQSLRARLLAELTDKGEHLDQHGHVAGALLYPPAEAAEAGARRYRKVVATQRFDFGKDVFAQTPVTFRYFRGAADGFTHQNGAPYSVGEIVTDRPIDTDRSALTWGIGVTPTGITDSPDYEPLLD